MTQGKAPPLEKRRAPDFERELLERARVWIPDWNLDESEPDFGLALLKIAARFSSEVAERLDKVGGKMALGFLDWLALRASAARPARMPVVLKLAETAREPVTAPKAVKMQVDVGDATVTFETETELRVIPGALGAIVAVDPASDAYFLPPPGLSSLDPAEPLPTSWRVKNFAAADSKLLQLDPGLGLAEEMLIEIVGNQYRVVVAKDDLVTIDPVVPAGGFDEGTRVTKVGAFRPFDAGTRNRQEHILYIGDPELLNVEAETRIELRGLPMLPADIGWEYWGKNDEQTDANDVEARWRPLTLGSASASRLIVHKPKGAVEPTQVGSAQARWIRARLARSDLSSTTDRISLRVNPLEDDTKPPPALTDPLGSKQLPPVDVFVNSTPSPASDFYPLGREPKLFDTLYLGSGEAFSKPGATAWIQFDLGDSTFAALSVLRVGLFAIPVVAGVGGDGALHLFMFDASAPGLIKLRGLEPLQPPLSGAATPDPSAPRTGLDRKTPWRLPMWQEANGFSIGAAAGGNVWIWEEKGTNTAGWRFAEAVPSTASPAGPIDGLVHLEGAPGLLFALRDGVLHWRSASGTDAWKALQTKNGAATVKLKTIVPVMVEVAGQLVTATAAGMIGVSDGAHPRLFKVAINGACTPLLAGQDVSLTVRPAAGSALDGTSLVVVAASLDRTELVVHDDNGNAPVPAALTGKATGGIEVLRHANEWHFLAAANNGSSRLISWAPLAARPILFESERPSALSELEGGPAALPGYVLIPGKDGKIFVVEFDLAHRMAQPATIEPGVVMPVSSTLSLIPSDTVALLTAGVPDARTIVDFGITKDQEILYPINSAFSVGLTPPLFAYRTSGSPQVGGFDPMALDQFTLANGDSETARGNWLLIDGAFKEVEDFVDATSNPRIVKVSVPFANALGAGEYYRPLLTGGREAPFIELNPATDGNWDAALLDRVPLTFPGATPARQTASAFGQDINNHPTLIVLGRPFTSLPVNPTFVVDAAAGDWTSSLGDTSTNPELAWEYWNGTGWWQLAIELDQTGHLKTRGVVRFRVPNDMAPTDWAGKTNHWVRARLIGGDYGKETVKVVTRSIGTNQTEQTVVRTTEGIQPPYALDVRVAYAVDQEAVPQFLLTRDSGTLRDQSDANRTPGALVEIFAPLAATLARFDAPAVDRDGPAQCIPDCECPTGTASASPAPPPHAAQPNADPAIARRSGQRALYLGFTAKLSGEPINLLFLVAREDAYDGIAPLAVDALIGDRFAPIVAADETRALGETGLLKMAFSVEPIQAELFGRTLSWLRLTPTGGDSDWIPSLAGIYPNAVWAQAAETMTRELVGSSNGQPLLAVAVTRPPLLEKTLELRVREPLGEEERATLIDRDPDAVRREIPDLPGDWVLWTQVADPVDCGPTDRVYALDEATGTIRFGDGLHGMIPPAGVDSIVAFAYRRSDAAVNGEVPANFVLPRAELNLVTPVESVESVVAADHSAGGVAPESPDHVLRFAPATLRHRGRAVSARDFEDLARQHSADVVQARCFVRNGRVRLVVVMRGDTPWPSNAQQRELRRMLLEVAPASLAAPDALTITGPAVRRLRIALVLRVATLDVAGTAASEAKDRLLARFHIERGGEAGDGWPMGSNPREDDIAEALLDLPGLEGIVSITLFEVDELGAERPWQGAVGPRELVMLAPSDIHIGFDVVEAVG